MRFDDVGLFWEDKTLTRLRGQKILTIQPFPDTGWRPPNEYPNLSTAKVLGIDIETYDPHLKERGPGWARNDGHIVGISLSTGDGYKRYFPIRHELQSEWNLDVDNTLHWLQDTLSLPMPKVGANLIYDCGWLWWEGIKIGGELHDVQVAQILINENSLVSLEILGQLYFGEGKASTELYQWCADSYGGTANGTQRKNIYRAPLSYVGLYAEQDADLPLQILSKQWPLLEKDNLLDIYRMEMELFPLLYEMRKRGVLIDLERATAMESQLTTDLENGYYRIKQMTGQDINSVWKANDLIPVFESLGFQLPFTANSTPENPRKSLNANWLKSCEHDVAKLVLELRQKQKLRDTFIRGYILNSHVNGRLHCQFHSMKNDENGTISGRFSSSTPNLQNIPKRGTLGKELRKLFLPDTGYKWRRYDQSQVEYRMLAHHAIGNGAQEIRRLYKENPNIDFHTTTGELIANFAHVSLPREPVKTVNFGVTYGMGEAALLANLRTFNPHITKQEVKDLLKAYHSGVPFAKSTLYYYMELAQKHGFVKTHLGRITHFDLWEPIGKGDYKPLPFEKAVQVYGYNLQRARTHKALNAVLQGGAADLMKMGMLLAWKEGIFHKIGIPSLTVHDELDFTDYGNPENEWKLLQHVLENAMPCSIPFICEPEIGINWGETHPINIGD